MPTSVKHQVDLALQDAGLVGLGPTAEALTISLVARLPVLLHGGRGLAKTAACRAVLARFFLDGDTAVRGLSSATTLEQLFGEVALSEQDGVTTRCFRVENAVFARPALLLDETLDAVGPVLEGLKTALTDRFDAGRDACELPSGQLMPLRTEVLFGTTNQSPAEWADGDASLEAFLGRFLILQVKRPEKALGADILRAASDAARRSYNRAGFSSEAAAALAEARKLADLVDDSLVVAALGQLIDEGVVDPRLAVWLVRACRALVAGTRGDEDPAGSRPTAAAGHLAAVLALVPGLVSRSADLEKEVLAAASRREALGRLEAAEAWAAALARTSPAGLVGAAKVLKVVQSLNDHVQGLQVTDDLVRRRDALRQGLQATGLRLATTLVSLTNIRQRDFTRPPPADPVDG